MKIGSRGVDPNAGLRQFSSPQVDFGPGISQALSRFGGAVSEMGEFAAEKIYRDRRSRADLARIEWEGEERRRLAEGRINVAPGAQGFTNAVHSSTEKSYEEFLKRVDVPEQDRAEYEAYFKAFQEEQTTGALLFEFEESNRYIGEQINTQADTAMEAVRADPGAFAVKKEELDILIDQSSLPPTVKEQLKKQTFNKLAGVVFQRETMDAQQNAAPVGSTDGSNAVAPGLSGAQRGFLNGVSRPESGGSYRRRYTPEGGANFEDLSQHPAIFEPTADGRQSSAAGRYQITFTTWNDALRQMRAAGYAIDGTFSEVNQDRVAWFISDQKYRGLTGRDLYIDLHSGDPALLRNVFDALGAQGDYADSGDPLFQGFRGEAAFNAFVQDVTGEAALPATPNAPMPDVWNDPRFAELPYDAKVALHADAQQATVAQQRQVRAEQEQREARIEQQLQALVAEGQFGVSYEIDKTLSSGVVQDPERVERLYKLAADDRKAAGQVQEVTAALTAKQPLPFGQSNEMLENYARSTGLANRLANNQGEDFLYDVYDRVGALPKSAVDALLAKANGGDAAGSAYGVRVLSQLYRMNRGNLTSLMTEEEARNVAAMSAIEEYAPSPEAAARTWATTQSPEFREAQAMRKKEMEKELESIDPSTVFYEMSSALETNTWFYNSARMPETPDQNITLLSDYRTAFERQYVLLGDRELAKDAAAKELAQVWGTNPVSGELMKYSPTLPIFGLESEAEGFDWIEPYVLRAIAAEEGTRFSLIGDINTLKAFKQTGRAVYAVVAQNSEGALLPPRVIELTKPAGVLARDAAQVRFDTVRKELNANESARNKERNPERAAALDRERVRLEAEFALVKKQLDGAE